MRKFEGPKPNWLWNLNLAIAMKDNKKCFYKYISNKVKAKEHLHSLLYAEGSTVTKRKQPMNLMPPLPQSYIKEQFYRYLVPELEDGDEEENKTTIIQRKQPATPLRHTQVYGARWDPPKGTKRAGGSAP